MSSPVKCDARYGMVINLDRCIGCGSCMTACAVENNVALTPQEADFTRGITLMRVDKTDNGKNYPDCDSVRIPVPCQHCHNTPCLSVCPVTAVEIDHRTGIVTQVPARCMGCRYCMVACPFQIPAYEYDNALDPEVKKCTFCYERVTRDGQLPACVSICPNEALVFGTREELIEAARSRIQKNPKRYTDHIYGEKEVGGTSWMYLAPADFDHTELPELTDEPIPNATEQIQHGIFKSFVPPLALYGLLGLVMHSLRHGQDDDDEEAGHESH